jgi:predicted nucleic acid-binding protein
LLESLPVIEDTQTAPERVRNVLPIAREFGLSAYDGAYLELAVRRGAALAALDAKLAKLPIRPAWRFSPGGSRQRVVTPEIAASFHF